jgi:hypothetical protein
MFVLIRNQGRGNSQRFGVVWSLRKWWMRERFDFFFFFGG